MIECVPVERLDFINAFRTHVHELATHSYGCRVLQRCFEYLPEEYIRPLLEEVNVHGISLMQNQFGVCILIFCVL